MFGGSLVPPVKPKHAKPQRVIRDIQLPCLQPNRYGHVSLKLSVIFYTEGLAVFSSGLSFVSQFFLTTI